MSSSHFLLRTHPLLRFFFFNDAATTQIYTLSLHDALRSVTFAPVMERGTGRYPEHEDAKRVQRHLTRRHATLEGMPPFPAQRSEEHTSELQSRRDLVCRLLLEKKKKNKPQNNGIKQKIQT